MSGPARRLAMAQWDVFSSRPLEGNSLAVFFDGRGLSDAEMQSIAKEMNLSETTFILPGDAAVETERGVRVRIFTVQEELPFAGHPTLGTAFALRGQTARREVKLNLPVGTVPVRFEDGAGRPTFAEMTQVDPIFGAVHAREAVAQVTGLRLEDFDESLPIQTVSTGLPYLVTPLKSLAVIRNLRLDMNRMAEYLAQTDGRFFLLCDSRNRGSRRPAACAHALLQWRGSRNRFGGRVHRGLDGGPWRCQTRRAGFDRTGPGDETGEPDFRAGIA